MLRLPIYIYISFTFTMTTCRMSGQVQWFKDQTEIQHGDNKYEMVNAGKIRTLIVKNISKSDAGKYTCKCKAETVTASMTVTGKDFNNMFHSSMLRILERCYPYSRFMF